MPLIQPITSPTPVRANHRSDAQDHQQPHATATAQASRHRQDNEIGGRAIEPTAPPSALQLQIKALISEQAETLAQDVPPTDEDRT